MLRTNHVLNFSNEHLFSFFRDYRIAKVQNTRIQKYKIQGYKILRFCNCCIQAIPVNELDSTSLALCVSKNNSCTKSEKILGQAFLIGIGQRFENASLDRLLSIKVKNKS